MQDGTNKSCLSSLPQISRSLYTMLRGCQRLPFNRPACPSGFIGDAVLKDGTVKPTFFMEIKPCALNTQEQKLIADEFKAPWPHRIEISDCEEIRPSETAIPAKLQRRIHQVGHVPRRDDQVEFSIEMIDGTAFSTIGVFGFHIYAVDLPDGRSAQDIVRVIGPRAGLPQCDDLDSGVCFFTQ